jgi:hypothetical protein
MNAKRLIGWALGAHLLATVVAFLAATAVCRAADPQVIGKDAYATYRAVADLAQELEDAGNWEGAAGKYLEAAGLHGMSWVKAQQTSNAANAYLCWAALTGNDAGRLNKARELVQTARKHMEEAEAFCSDNPGHRACPAEKIAHYKKVMGQIWDAAGKRLAGEWKPVRGAK